MGGCEFRGRRGQGEEGCTSQRQPGSDTAGPVYGGDQ